MARYYLVVGDRNHAHPLRNCRSDEIELAEFEAEEALKELRSQGDYTSIVGVGRRVYTKLYLCKLVDEGTGSTFNALEARGFIKCKYTWKRRDGDREAMERFLMLQITKEGRALVRSATGAKAYRPGAPGVLKEWHWKAMAAAWRAR